MSVMTADDMLAVLDELAALMGAIHAVDTEDTRKVLWAFAMRQRAMGARMVITQAQDGLKAWAWAERPEVEL